MPLPVLPADPVDVVAWPLVPLPLLPDEARPPPLLAALIVPLDDVTEDEAPTLVVPTAPVVIAPVVAASGLVPQAVARAINKATIQLQRRARVVPANQADRAAWIIGARGYPSGRRPCYPQRMPIDVDLGPVVELPEGRGRCVDSGPVGLAVFRLGEQVFALENACPHRGGPLAEGDLREGIVYCPLHAWGFDVRNGDCVNVRRERAKSFPVRVEAGRAVAAVPMDREAVDADPWLA